MRSHEGGDTDMHNNGNSVGQTSHITMTTKPSLMSPLDYIYK